MAEPRVLGVDAFKGGWIGIAVTATGFAGAYVNASIEKLVEGAGRAEVIAVDIPIGLPASGTRDADSHAKSMVGLRHSSVFMTPVRAAVFEDDYTTAVALNRRSPGPGISKQAHALRHKIREIDAWVDRHKLCVIEAHPEVSFAAMARGHVHAPKKSWAGAVERRRLLREHGIEVPDELGDAGRAGIDDVLDAAAAAWTARRIAFTHDFAWLPEGVDAIPGKTDSVIWY
jgi:predicted RNase H-like nuclease